MFSLPFFLCFIYSRNREKIGNYSSLSPFIANYPLTEDFLFKFEEISKECKNLFPKLKETNNKNDSITHDDNVEEYIVYISRKPKLVNILKENNIIPRDFVIGLLIFQTTLNVLTNEEISPHE
ncbi:hypothetical protein [Bartonella birtlesii]|uniref:Uncharacterized protein n=1 Tax=Bartonella birtlesii LL-WM9 TaxID=1094552 RepID=J0YP76_9HYPH|nr:hypothetical protein [Bartonella birtlesii]EJF76493.1 hypothetical protein ME7_01037 [Bartonella birtlesii LL-WM9]